MQSRTRILHVLALQFATRKAGRTGAAANRPTFALKTLLELAHCDEGEARQLAELDLSDAERFGILERVPFHNRDPNHIEKIRVPIENETALFAAAGLPTPTDRRMAFASQFAAAAESNVPECWKKNWRQWCEQKRAAALSGQTVPFFDREDPESNQRLLDLLPKLLSWNGESLVRFASCVLFGNSKTLEELATSEKGGDFQGKLRGKLGKILEEITAGQVCALDDLGILSNPRFVLIHGPLKLQLGGEWLDFGQLQGAFRLSETDVQLAKTVGTTARRCLTVENETSFHELAKLQSGELLVQTSYPGSGTLKLLSRLPADMEFWHFGDSDEAGFDILRVLRERSRRDFKPLHMQPGRVPFEQESLGRPTSPHWPFYP